MMTEISRRAALMGTAGAAAMVALTPTPRAEGATVRTTLIVSPHPDDELLRGAGYINWAAHRGDRLILLAVTDGGATAMGRSEGLSRSAVEERRAAEQVGCWSALTYGKGEIVRAGLPDGALSHSAVRNAVQNVLARNPGAEVFVAAHQWDTTRDHQVVWQACRDSGAAVVRYMKDPTYSGGGTGTHYPTNLSAAQDALEAYWWTLGPRSSVGGLRNAMVKSGFRTRYGR